jgi:hypothetical protein
MPADVKRAMMQKQLFTVTAADLPICIVSALDAMAAIDIAAKLARLGKVLNPNLLLRTRMPTELECLEFREWCFSSRSTVELGGILIGVERHVSSLERSVASRSCPN